MAADASSPAGPNLSTDAARQPQKLPSGVVLGKDGKPCRTCSSGAAFAAFASQAKSTLKSGAFPGALVGAAVSSSSLPPPAYTPPADCPPDVAVLGRSTWTLLHSIAATYPTTPSQQEQKELKTFMGLFSRLYPCWVCAEDFQGYMAKEQIRVGSRDEFGKWLCEAHNAVNVKVGKKTFDCARWEERWRTGWKDGRCD
ncbi:Erv1/Alr family protein [Pseudomassariella vexata]|uniref:Sulfhydryl oxidase n=1 Tax=Pseudomassariella vexata TaxID=1141098 RepID=A0A1Y2DNL0_9PEZI|nr:Erv1/Alr family protein [Pseudomassariella vexata]ORY60883.1 Erv1/Alr family protein [Pseudomassariella vexata]